MSSLSNYDNSFEEHDEDRSALKLLEKAVRRSIYLFIVAVLIIGGGIALSVWKSIEILEILEQKGRVDTFLNNTLSMRVSEKDYYNSFSEADGLKFDKEYDSGNDVIGKMLASFIINAKDSKKISRLSNGLRIYNENFNKTIDIYRQRGTDATTGSWGRASAAKNDIVAEIKKMRIVHLEDALRLVSDNAEEFIIFERAQQIQKFNESVNDFEKAIFNDRSISDKMKNKLLDSVAQYRNAINEYIELTSQIKAKMKDSTLISHAVTYPLPSIITELKKRQVVAVTQVIYILTAMVLFVITIYTAVVYQLRQARNGTVQVLQETVASRKKAEEENEILNNSVIEILEAVNLLSQRDLTVRAPVSEDIIGTVSAAINALSDETAKVLSEVTEIANRVADASENVKSQASLVTKTAEEERIGVEKMLEALLDATQTMNQVAALAEQSDDSASEATQVTDDALITVNETVEGMESIREIISETEKRIKRLGERSQEISGIVNLINTISERTHVLALNASMQAAVAGEAGRGFAVVAEEVQRLAESSRNATQQIATLVNNIQIETNETINTVNQTIGQVVEGSTKALRAGEQMKLTQEITSRLVAQVRSITRASEKQKEMSGNLLEAIQKIGDSTEQTARQIEAQNKETASLLSASVGLVDSVSVFKLPPMRK